MAFHLGCLRALERMGLLAKVQVLSTISGGSVIGAYYAYTPHKTFDEFDADIRTFLKGGFQRSIAVSFLRPDNLVSCVVSSSLTHLAEGIALATGREPSRPRAFSRTDIFRNILDRDVFYGTRLESPRRNDLSVVIGATELRYGTAFRFGNDKSGDRRRGQLISNDIDVAFAVAASAAYPVFLPALDRSLKFTNDSTETEHRVCLTDGGVYDNLGIQVLEPGRDPAYSSHYFPCDYLIACNAGHGQDSGDQVPLGFYRRVNRSFSIIHRRVQDSAMARLHALKSSGALKGFAMPYLGQLDDRVKWNSDKYVRRNEVIGYGTNFSAMSEDWIQRLSKRGEQLTSCLILEYMPELL